MPYHVRANYNCVLLLHEKLYAGSFENAQNFICKGDLKALSQQVPADALAQSLQIIWAMCVFNTPLILAIGSEECVCTSFWLLA